MRNALASAVVVGIMLSGPGWGVAPEEPLKFNVLDQIKPGITTKAQVKSIVGVPSKIINYKELPEGESGESWQYFEKDLKRLSIFFESGAATVDSWIWHVYSKEAEQPLLSVLTRFPGAHWLGETEKFVNPHDLSPHCFYRDEASGVTIDHNEVRKEVVTISRRAISGKPSASREDEKPPQVCIDDHCVPEIPAKDWAGMGAPVCDVPKLK